MLRNRRKDILIALALIAPFVAIYGLVFVYPTIRCSCCRSPMRR